MKKYLSVILAALFFMAFSNVNAQDETNAANQIPKTEIQNLKGEKVLTSTLGNDGKPFVISFWATWCKPCIAELKAINEVYSDWQEQTGVKFIAVSIDDAKTSKLVAPFVKGRKFTYDVYLDENSDFKRLMNVSNPPHLFLFNGKGEKVWEHTGYAPGDEEELFKQIKKISDTESK